MCQRETLIKVKTLNSQRTLNVMECSYENPKSMLCLIVRAVYVASLVIKRSYVVRKHNVLPYNYLSQNFKLRET